MSLTRLFDFDEKLIGEELMAITADVQALVTRLGALAQALPTYVAAQVAEAETAATTNEADNVAALAAAITPLEAVIEPAPAPAA